MKIKRFALGALWTNCYVVSDANGDGIVVDPGGPAVEVEEYIRDNDIRLHWIILTHGHGDHIGGVSELRNLSENGIAIHAEDADCLVDANRKPLRLHGRLRGTAFGGQEAERRRYPESRQHEYQGHPYAGTHAGGICLHITEGEEEILISGDTLFARSIEGAIFPAGMRTC
jgi:glyoxylase-like metal-dependent hydrolase (beta-lactamase superfamily II)